MSDTASRDRIDIRGLRMQYGDGIAAAVDDIDLTIEAGEFVTLLGPSGSGKTTTLNLLAGFLQPTSGSIRLGDVDLVSVPPNKRSFGMVFQDYALFPHMTVFDNVAFPLRQRRTERSQIRHLVGDILDRFGLGGFESRKPAALSGGQRQRVALARAIVFSPSVLLLDEPLGALDRKLRFSLQAEIKKLHRELGLSFVFVTHDQEEAMFLSDKIAVFNRGRIERVGSPRELYDDPGTEFVAEFLGEANIFHGEPTAPDTYAWADRSLRTAPASTSAGRTLLLVRPEHVGVFSDSDVPPGWNSVPADVIDVSDLGATTRVDLRFPDATAGMASLPTDSARSLRPGDAAWAAWPPAAQRFVTPQPTDTTTVAVSPTV